MSKTKLFLSILLLAALIGAGICLPQRLKAGKQEKQVTSKAQDTSKTAPAASLTFRDFEKLSDFLTDKQVSDLKESFPKYIEKTGIDSASVTFLPDETSYPDVKTTQLSFRLSDKETLSVTYSHASDVFTFKSSHGTMQLQSSPRSYGYETDETLPEISTYEIESRQEGGYPDTQNDKLPEDLADKAAVPTPTATPPAGTAPASKGVSP